MRTIGTPSKALLCAALALATIAAAFLPGRPAGATPLTLTCTGLKGSAGALYGFVHGTVTLSGCTGTGLATTGSHGEDFFSLGATTGTFRITWATGRTSVETFTYTEYRGQSDTCPSKTGSSQYMMVTLSGHVTSGTANGLIGSVVSGTSCVYSQRGSYPVFGKGLQHQ